MESDAESRVLVDTCVWVSFFQSKGSKNKQAIQSLLDKNRVCIIAPIAFEILRGIKRRSQAVWLDSELRKIPELSVEWKDWVGASNLHRTLVVSGHELPMADLCIAAIALRHDVSVFSTDPHFDCIPQLKRYSLAS